MSKAKPANQTNRSPPDKLRKPNKRHAPWLMRRIWDRINRQNEHFMAVIVGQEGSGKSYTAVKIAEEVDPTFNKDRIIFDIADLLEILQDGQHEKGQFYVLDEAGVQLGRRTWQERGQVLANQALQLIRNHNLGLLFTLPRLGELDSQAQGRLQAFIELIDKEHGEYVTGKWKWMDPDRADQTGTIYKKYPRRRRNGQVLRLTRVRFTPPSESIVEPYERKKREFQKQFYERTIAKLRGEDPDEEDVEEEKDPAIATFEDIVEEDKVDEYRKTANNGRVYFDDDLIELDYGISARKSQQVKKLLAREYEGGDT